MIAADDLKAKIATCEVPYLRESLGQAGVLKKITIAGNTAEVFVSLGFPTKTTAKQLQSQLSALSPDMNMNLHVNAEIIPHTIQQGLRSLPEVKNIIAVASGKGGVGKSTVCANLAVALAEEGAKVGILDADIYGPNQPQMLGLSGHPEGIDEKKLYPKVAHGVQVMSIGFLIEQDDTPMIWRGPMVSTALQQLLNDTQWQSLDYLFIDLPPGTGDIQLTLSQKIPVTAALIVTTPQDIALLDAKKALRMFEKVKVPVLGVIENMSTHVCSQCGYEEKIFGEGGAEKMVARYQVEHLGSLPLALRIRADMDQGQPSVIKEPQSTIAKIYRDIALRVAAKLSLQGKDYSRKFPKIVIE